VIDLLIVYLSILPTLRNQIFDDLCQQLMQKQRKMRGILRGMTSILSAPVTVKMRIGWDEKKPNAHILLPTVIQQFAGIFHYILVIRSFHR
jgi:Dihydrouridine synthase (Dus)